MSDHTIHFNNDIAKSLKSIYKEQENFEKENRQAPLCKKINLRI